MSTTAEQPDPLAAVPPPDVLRRLLADLTRRRTLLQALLRASVRIANYPPNRSEHQPTAAHAMTTC